MSENDIDYAQKLRDHAQALLSIAEQLDRKSKEGKDWASEPPHLTQDSFENPNTNTTEVDILKNSQILLSQKKYQTCHIRVPESEEYFPAVVVDRDYYSLVRVFPDIKRVLAAKAKFEWNGDRTVMTQAATGYALWIWEPDAQQDGSIENNASDTEEDLADAKEGLYLVTVSNSQTQAKVSLTDYLLVFNRLSSWANHYLGTAVVVHYWKSTRPELPWIEQIEVVGSAQIICRNVDNLSWSVWQEKQLQLWMHKFIQRCRRVIPQFPQPFLNEYKSNQLLANLLDEHFLKED